MGFKKIISLFFLGSHFFAIGQSKKMQNKQTILFVCEHGAGRSAIASAYFNTIAKNKGLNYHSIFRGIDPQEALGPSTKNGLIADSIDVSNMIPKKVSKSDILSAYKVVTLDCILPDSLNKADFQWTGIPMDGNYQISRKEIALKVDSLIAQLPVKKIKKK